LSTQLVGRRGGDERLLDHARRIESMLGRGWCPAPAVNVFPLSRFN
jgi:Asp-tRNA(Asn)/Glu-tRNA(Gln) amidotransferase A subunit family amidase